MSNAELSILIRAKNMASSVLKEVEGSVSSLGSKLGTALKVGAVAGAAGIVGVGLALKGFVEDAMTSQKVMTQTNAVLASTKGVSGETASSVNDLANSLSMVIPYDDELIQSTENMLLTFTKVGKDVFPQATEAALDMATALGTDPVDAAMKLGKALNDPIAGVTALRKVGVMLTDQQKDQIKSFMAVGDIASAQKVILSELSTEFGGSARAAGDTFGGKLKILSTQIDNVKERIGLALIPLLSRVADVAIQYVVPAIEDGITALSDFGTVIHDALTGDLAGAAEAFNRLPAPLQVLAMWLAENKQQIIEWANTAKGLAEDVVAGWIKILTALAPKLKEFGQFLIDHKPLLIALAVAVGVLLVVFGGIPIAIATIIVAGGLLGAHWDDIKAKLQSLWQSFKDNFTLIYLIVVYYFESIKNEVTLAINVVRDVITIAMALINGDWGAAWEGIKQLASDVWEGIKTSIGLEVGLIRDIIVYGLTVAKNLAVGVMNEARDGIAGAWESVRNRVGDAIDWIIGKIQDLIDKAHDLTDLGGIAGKVLGSIAGAAGFANGGVTPGGMVLVGERGPELVNLPAGSRVHSNSDSRQMLSGAAGATTVIHYHIQTWQQVGDAASGLALGGAV